MAVKLAELAELVKKLASQPANQTINRPINQPTNKVNSSQPTNHRAHLPIYLQYKRLRPPCLSKLIVMMMRMRILKVALKSLKIAYVEV